MRNWKGFFYNLLFAANCLLLFLVVMEGRLIMPAWLQVAGRLHPMILHFPLVLLLLSIAWESASRFGRISAGRDGFIGNGLLLSTAVTAVLAALMGFILSREPGYDPALLFWHKWSGVIFSLLCFAWYALRSPIRKSRALVLSFSGIGLITLVIAGHQGASITHGDDFILAPIASQQEIKMVPFDQAKVFDHVVQPILAEKCNGCHNAKKAKGELIMENVAAFVKGGKNGILWDTTAKDLGLLLRRIHLPIEDKKHMPPKGKPALTEEEIAILFYWIRAGANTNVRLNELQPTDSLRILTAAKFENSGPEVFTFEAADPAAIEKLNNHYRLVTPVAAGSPALEASLFGAAAYSAVALKELQPIAKQLVSLRLDHMPVTDADLDLITPLTTLRELHLSFTKVTDGGIRKLKTLPLLKTVSLSGTAITLTGLKELKSAPAIKTVYCWNIAGSQADLQQLRKDQPGINWENGFYADTVHIKLNPPIIENEEVIFADTVSIRLKHFIKGSELRYTLDDSEPDSLNAAIYSAPIPISKSTSLRTKAFRKGWIASDAITRSFYLKGRKPDSLWFRVQPDSGYRQKGTETLFDGEKGGLVYREKKWLGFRNNPLELYMQFREPVDLNRLELSMLEDVSSYIFPAVSIELSTATPGGKFKPLSKLNPVPATKETTAIFKLYTCSFPQQKIRTLRLLVQPIKSIPKWHKGKKEKGWVFVDEIFLQ